MLTILMLVATILLIAADQLTKVWAVVQLHQAERIIPVIDGVFEFHYAENPGVAFSMLEGQRWIFIPITVIIGSLILIMMLRSPLRCYPIFNATCVLILSGAIGNLIDRIAYGYVIDFLYFRLIDFPIFNFADCCVVVGAGLLFVFLLFILKDDDMPLRTLFFGIVKKNKEKTDGLYKGT